jgi:hypothetical protein
MHRNSAPQVAPLPGYAYALVSQAVSQSVRDTGGAARAHAGPPPRPRRLWGVRPAHFSQPHCLNLEKSRLELGWFGRCCCWVSVVGTQQESRLAELCRQSCRIALAGTPAESRRLQLRMAPQPGLPPSSDDGGPTPVLNINYFPVALPQS